MKICNRIKKLEKKLLNNKETWAVFKIAYYTHQDQKTSAQQRLLKEYLAQGYPYPSYCLFINDVPGSCLTPQEEKFLYSYSCS